MTEATSTNSPFNPITRLRTGFDACECSADVDEVDDDDDDPSTAPPSATFSSSLYLIPSGSNPSKFLITQ